MSLSLLLLLLIQVHTEGTDGPALPLDLLKGEAPVKTTVSDYWVDGYYQVEFEYRVSRPVAELGAQFAKEKFVTGSTGHRAGSSFVGNRDGDGVLQTVSIYRRVLQFVSSGPKGREEGVKEDPYTTVTVIETVRPGVRPSKWYAAAVSKTPPAPMIEIPCFRPSKATTVSLSSFEGLMSSKGMRFTGKDAAVYTAVIAMSLDEATAQFEVWAKANGYTRTPIGSWFKAGAKMFEIQIGHAEKGNSIMTVYTSDRKAVHPIAWEKF